MNLYKVLVNGPHRDNGPDMPFVKFVYADNDDWYNINKIVRDLIGMEYMVIITIEATDDEEIAFLDGRVLGIEEGFSLLSEM